MNKNLYNIHIMGVGFMFIFSATFTASFIEVIVFKDFNRHGINGKTGDFRRKQKLVLITDYLLKLDESDYDYEILQVCGLPFEINENGN